MAITDNRTSLWIKDLKTLDRIIHSYTMGLRETSRILMAAVNSRAKLGIESVKNKEDKNV